MPGFEFKVFHGVGAVIAEIKSDTLFSVLAITDDGKFVDFSNIGMRFSVDMTRTPSRVKIKDWEKVLVDDRGVDKDGKELKSGVVAASPLGVTSIGSGSSDDPQRGIFSGGVYLEQNYFRSLQSTQLSGWPEKPGDVTLLRLTSIAYSKNPINEPKAGKRYHGFPAAVTSIVGNKVTVGLTDRDENEPIPFTFTRDDAGAYDPDPPAEALGEELSLAKHLAVGKAGALFVELGTAVQAQLFGVKLPIGEGE